MRKRLVGCIATLVLSTTLGVASLSFPTFSAVVAEDTAVWKDKVSYNTSEFTLTEDYTAYTQATCFSGANAVKYNGGEQKNRLDLGKSGLLLTSTKTGAEAVGSTFNFTKTYTGAFTLDFRVLSKNSFSGNIWDVHNYSDITSLGITFTSVSDPEQAFTVYYETNDTESLSSSVANVLVGARVAVNGETYNNGNGAAIYKASSSALNWTSAGYVLQGNTFCNVAHMLTSGTYPKTKSYPTSLSFDPATMKVHSKEYTLTDLATKSGFNESSQNWLLRDLSSAAVYQDEVAFGSKWTPNVEGLKTIDPSYFEDGYKVSMFVNGMTEDATNARTAQILLYNVGGEEYRSQTKIAVSDAGDITLAGLNGTGYTFTANTQNEAAENMKMTFDGADFYNADNAAAIIAVGASTKNMATETGATTTAYYALDADGGVSDIAYEYDPYADVRALGVTFRSKTDDTKAFTVYLQSRSFKSNKLIARVGVEGEAYRNSSGTKGFAVYGASNTFNPDGQYRSLDGTLGMYNKTGDSPYVPLKFDAQNMVVYGYAENKWYELRDLTEDYTTTFSGKVPNADLMTLNASDFTDGYTVEISVEMMNNNWNRGRSWLYNTWGAYLKQDSTADGYLIDEAYDREAKISVFALNGTEKYCFDWDKNGACDGCGKFFDGMGAVKGASLSLNGNIGVNFYMDIAESVKENEESYLKVSYANKEYRLFVKDAEYDATYGYKFTVDVAAKDADAEITAQLVSGETSGNTYTYSIMQYANKLLADDTGAYDGYKSVVNALITYTDFAKASFVEGVEAPAATTEMQAITRETVADYKMTVSGEDANVEIIGISLLLKSNTALRLYFAVGETVPTVTVDGQEVEVYSKNVGEEKAYYVEIGNIAANKLDVFYTVKIGEITVSCSALSFAETVLNTDGADMATVNLVKALYLYNQAANECLGD